MSELNRVYRELLDRVSQFANGLKAHGIKKGDRVLIYLPMSIEGVVAMPECTAMEANYYVREGNYFTEYNREQLQRIFDAAREMGRTDITLKCADETCYREICRVLIDEQEIFSYIPDSNSTISYAQNGKQLSLTFWVTNE